MDDRSQRVPNTKCGKVIHRFYQVSQAPVKFKLNLVCDEEMIKATSIWCSDHQSSLVCETLKEVAVRDLRRGPDENPTNKMNDKRGRRGLGPQHPRPLDFDPISGGTPALVGLLCRLRDHLLDLGVELYRSVGRSRRRRAAGPLPVVRRAAGDNVPPPPPTCRRDPTSGPPGPEGARGGGGGGAAAA